MKRIISFILIYTYLFSTIGFSMQVHECGNKKEYSFYGVQLHTHCKCKHKNNAHSKKCCSDKKTIVKSEKKDCQISKINVVTTNSNFAFISLFTSTNNEIDKTTKTATIYRVKQPPNYSSPLYILYSVYRI